MQNQGRQYSRSAPGNYPGPQQEYAGRKYEIEYVHNGFWLGGFKKGKIENIINSRVRKGWKYVGMESHSSIFLLMFRRTSLVLTFYKDF